jgi:hypothetical protein
LLDARGIEAPILVGHSDGGSIALIHAGGSGRPVAGVATLAAHVFNEDVCVRSIEAARRAFETTDLKDKLGRYHDDPEGAFLLWNQAWLAPSFLDWNIEEYLPGISCPVLAMQGVDDEYGTAAQIEAIARGVGGPVETVAHRELPPLAPSRPTGRGAAAVVGLRGVGGVKRRGVHSLSPRGREAAAPPGEGSDGGAPLPHPNPSPKGRGASVRPPRRRIGTPFEPPK